MTSGEADDAGFDFLNLEEVEVKAKSVMTKMAYDYYSGGEKAGAPNTHHASM